MKPDEYEARKKELGLRVGDECRVVTHRPYPDDETDETVGTFDGDWAFDGHTSPTFLVGGQSLGNKQTIHLGAIVSIDRVLPRE